MENNDNPIDPIAKTQKETTPNEKVATTSDPAKAGLRVEDGKDKRSYIDLLKDYPNKGVHNPDPIKDSDEDFSEKCRQLKEDWSKALRVLVITGAGISTSCGIPDFRGPDGIWAREARGEKPDKMDMANAIPSYTHFSLVELERMGKILWLLSQNVDNLHAKSGFPLKLLAEIFGNNFVEKCNHCKRKYYRNAPLNSIGTKPTGKPCEGTLTGRPCRGKLHDVCLNWEDALPKEEWQNTLKIEKTADLVIVLGTSLMMEPVNQIPLMAKARGATVWTISLQPTKYESEFTNTIHRDVDEVFKRLADLMGFVVKPADQYEPYVLNSIHTPAKISRKRANADKNAETESQPKTAKMVEAPKEEANEKLVNNKKAYARRTFQTKKRSARKTSATKKRAAKKLVATKKEAAEESDGNKKEEAAEKFVYAKKAHAKRTLAIKKKFARKASAIKKKAAEESTETKKEVDEGSVEAKKEKAEKSAEAKNEGVEESAGEKKDGTEALVEDKMEDAKKSAETKKEDAGELAEDKLEVAGALAETKIKVAGALAETKIKVAGALAETKIKVAEALIETKNEVVGASAKTKVEVVEELAEDKKENAGELAKTKMGDAERLVNDKKEETDVKNRNDNE